MSFRITGLDPAPFRPLYGLPEAELAAAGARRYVVDAVPSYPDRIELKDADVGESVLLVNHLYQGADTPYRASHAIFVREGAETTFDAIDVVPDMLRPRMLSLRAFAADHMMVDADLVAGSDVESLIERLLADPHTAYIQAHFAKRGCYAARIERA